MNVFFWIAMAVLFYTYIGYGIFLITCNVFFKRKKAVNESSLPPVTFIVPAFNEEAIIEQKVKNSLSLSYPSDKIFFVFVTDGCTDKTTTIISRYPQIRLLHQAERMGKAAAINRAMEYVQTPLVVFSDANVLLHGDSVKNLVRHYTDAAIGGVSGEKRIADHSHSAIGFGEKLYWQYESLLKKASAGFYTLVGAAGELFSIRTKLYRSLSSTIILDDFVISANVCRQGYRFMYDAEAYGTETSSASMEEERKRKIRISAGCFQALVSLKGLLNPIKNPRLCFQYVSHRVLRWAVCPLLLPLLFIANLYLLKTEMPIYTVLFFAQCFFYLLVMMGWAMRNKNNISSPVFIPYYFVFMIASQYAGFYRFVRNRQSVFWEKAVRKPVA